MKDATALHDAALHDTALHDSASQNSWAIRFLFNPAVPHKKFQAFQRKIVLKNQEAFLLS